MPKICRGNKSSLLQTSVCLAPRILWIIGLAKVPHDPNMNSRDCPPGTWHTICILDKIQRLLIQHNQKHFGQAAPTPFTAPHLKELFGFNGSGYAADLVLQREFNFPTLDSTAKLLTWHICKLQTCPALFLYKLTKKEKLSKLKAWPKKTHLHLHLHWVSILGTTMSSGSTMVAISPNNLPYWLYC